MAAAEGVEVGEDELPGAVLAGAAAVAGDERDPEPNVEELVHVRLDEFSCRPVDNM